MSSMIINAPGTYSTQSKRGVMRLKSKALACAGNATMVLSFGNAWEQHNVLLGIDNLIARRPEDEKTLIPFMCRAGASWTTGAQVTLIRVLRERVLPPYKLRELSPHLAREIVDICVHLASSTNHAELYYDTVDLAARVIPTLHKHDVLDYVGYVTDMVNCEGSPLSKERYFAAAVIGPLALSLESKEIMQMLYAPIERLVFDGMNSVRICMGQSIGILAAKMPITLATEKMWPLLAARAAPGIEDDEVTGVLFVRDLVESIHEHHSPIPATAEFASTYVALFDDCCRHAINLVSTNHRNEPHSPGSRGSEDECSWLYWISVIFGMFLVTLPWTRKDGRHPPNRRLALKTFHEMATCSIVSVRQNCAYNLPMVCSVFGSQMQWHLETVIQALANDSHADVRQSLANVMYKTAKSLCTTPLRNTLVKTVIALVQDEDETVQMSCIDHFSDVCNLLSSPHDKSKRNRAVFEKTELVALISSLRVSLHGERSLQYLVLVQLEKIVHLLPSHTLRDEVAPLLFDIARAGDERNRKPAIRLLVHVLRGMCTHEQEQQHKDHYCQHTIDCLKAQWATFHTFQGRKAYLDAFCWAVETTSKNFVHFTFGSFLLRLQQGEDAEVRQHVTQYLEEKRLKQARLDDLMANDIARESRRRSRRRLIRLAKNAVRHLRRRSSRQKPVEESQDTQPPRENGFKRLFGSCFGGRCSRSDGVE